MALRILHCIASVNPANGGPIEGIRQIAAAMDALGHSTTVVCLDSPESSWVSEFPIKCFAVGGAIGKYRYSRRLVPWLRERASQFDVVIVNGIWQFNSLGVWLALRRIKKPYFVFTHGMLDPWFKKAFPVKHLKKWLYWPWGEYRVLRDAAAVFFTCEEERILARQSFWLYRCNEVVIPYGTRQPPDDMAGRLRAAFEGRFPEVAGKRCILFLGRLHPKKGIEALLWSFSTLVQIGPASHTTDLHLVIAGPDDSHYAAKLKRMAASLNIAQRVTWTGLLQHESKWGAFHRAEVFILPSHQENFGIAVAEALGCGLPVLLSNKVNIWREVVSSAAGYVEADTRAGTLALLEQWLSTSPEARRCMGAAALSCFSKHFDVSETAKSIAAAVGRHKIVERALAVC